MSETPEPGERFSVGDVAKAFDVAPRVVEASHGFTLLAQAHEKLIQAAMRRPFEQFARLLRRMDRNAHLYRDFYPRRSRRMRGK